MENVSILIPSCDAFSDVLEGTIASLERFWPDCGCKIYVSTDAEPKTRYQGVEFINAGKIEYSDRLKYALERINSKYVIIILDDYFISKKVNTSKIRHYIDIMKENNVGYFRLSDPRKEKRLFDKNEKIWVINTSDHRYAANLYIGIWDKTVLTSMCVESQNPWQFEVSLSEKLDKLGTFCLGVNKASIKIVDVVRKGAITRESYSYIHSANLYHGTRKKQTLKDWWRLKIIDVAKAITPRKFHKKMKLIMEKHGHTFYSNWEKGNDTSKK
jgi:hypothetical protein